HNKISDNPSPDSIFDTDSISNDKLSKKKEFWWYREDEAVNYRTPLMFPDDSGHITEYLQIRISRTKFLDVKKENDARVENIIRENLTTEDILADPGGAGKSGIVFELLTSNYMSSQKNKNQVLIGGMEDVEQKHKGFIPFLAKYVFMISYKPLEEAFNFCRNHINDKSFTQQDWDQFYRRLDFIIEFTEK
ncbi:347_t:CDS:2, partial [Dentiscutata heterogama]